MTMLSGKYNERNRKATLLQQTRKKIKPGKTQRGKKQKNDIGLRKVSLEVKNLKDEWNIHFYKVI